MHRALIVALACACSSSTAPPPRPRPKPPVETVVVPDAALPAPSGPSWVGIRIEADSLRVIQVIRDAPGARAGIQIGDQLVSIDNEAVTTVPMFVERVSRTPVGQRVSIVVVREGKQVTVPVLVDARPESPATATLVGKPAPAFAASPLSGPFAPKLADLRGKVVVVDFWATWCGPCTVTIPRLVALHDKYESAGLRIVGLSSEDPADIQKFVANAGINYAIGRDADDAIAHEYLRDGIPMFVVIDRGGIVRNVVVGADMVTVEAAVASLLTAP